MTNYTQTNIYRKQIQQLGLNPKQYAKLINMPYEVVKDIIYDKEGDYNMDIKNILRKNMFEKHQEIENNMENAKLKAIELRNEKVDYLKWYEKEYTNTLLKAKLKLKSIVPSFRKKYIIKINDKEASNWYYSNILNKTNYAGKELNEEKKLQFIEQLYDILVNENYNKYLRNNEKIDTKLLNWYKEFDFEVFKDKYNLTSKEIAEKIGLAYTTICLIISHQYKGNNAIQKMYDFVKVIEETHNNNETKIFKFDNVKPIEKIETPIVITTNAQEQEIQMNNDAILRKLLINRLTDEERELIRIFGGKLD